MTYLVGIAGGSGSGKGTIADLIQQHLQAWEVRSFTLSTDDCYKDLSHLDTRERDDLCFNPDFNFDHPRVVDFDRLLAYAQRLKEGQEFEYPKYDFKVHKYCEEKVVVPVNLDVAIVEGIYALYSGNEVGGNTNKLISLYDHRLFVITRPEIALMRRLERDIKERERNIDHVLKQLRKTVIPMYGRFIGPTRLNADDVIRWEIDNPKNSEEEKRKLVDIAYAKALTIRNKVREPLLEGIPLDKIKIEGLG